MNKWPLHPDRITLMARNIPQKLHNQSSNKQFQFLSFAKCISKVTVTTKTMETNNLLIMLDRIGVNAEICNKIHNN